MSLDIAHNSTSHARAGPRQAHGLCFSVQKGVQTPPSLVNIYKELSQDPGIPNFTIPKHGCLTKWAQQGVLLLNACLSVESGKANSHKDQGWEKFTDAVIEACNKHHNNLVFLLWGAPAAKKCQKVDKKRHTVLTAPHPSPLSAHRGFFGCKHFSHCNAQLVKVGRPPIDWQID
jgi:uracil-DNA glycosylase